MTLEEKLTALLRTICPRVFRKAARSDTPMPYFTYQRLGGRSMEFADSTLPSKRNALVQINVWSASQIEADNLIQQAEAALLASAELQTEVQGESRDASEPDMEMCGASQDFSIWADR